MPWANRLGHYWQRGAAACSSAQIAVIESWVLAKLRASVILPNLRKTVPAAEHVRKRAQPPALAPGAAPHSRARSLLRRVARLGQPYFVSVATDGAPIRRALHMDNALLGHVLLVDAAGHVRWQAHGDAAPGEAERLIQLTRRLLSEAPETAGNSS